MSRNWEIKTSNTSEELPILIGHKYQVRDFLNEPIPSVIVSYIQESENKLLLQYQSIYFGPLQIFDNV